MGLKIALIGNPNSGKSTLFNSLTGSSQYVGNWPGVTVEKKEGKLKKHKNVIITDLPGIYSLSPYTAEEVVSRNYLVKEDVDAIINIIDGSNLERNLYLTTQILELGIPTLIGINMMDVVEKRGDKINTVHLAKELGCEVFELSALKNKGIDDVNVAAVALAKRGGKVNTSKMFSADIEKAIGKISKLVPDTIDDSLKRWYAIKLFERDKAIVGEIPLDNEAEMIINELEEKFDNDSESIITSERYKYVDSIIGKSLKRNENAGLDTSDKIDRIVTHRVFGLPIFAAVMWSVYYIAVTTVGKYATNWMNDVLFGQIVAPNVSLFLERVNTADWLQGLVVDGIISGVGAVLSFVPQLLVLFVLLGILEECGYMSRIAYLLDRLFRKFGLSGKSFIPILIGTGCGVPGVMASRTIENEQDRRMTIMTTTFIPCGAKLPIIALIAGALFGGASWVAPSAYLIGIGAIIFSGIALRKTKAFAGEAAPFVMELPDYHWPTPQTILRVMWERGWSFIKKAGTVILISTVIIWGLSNFGFKDGNFGFVSDMSDSFLAMIGGSLSFLFKPLGFGNWKATVATITGLVAKENVVGTFGVLYKVAEDNVGNAGQGVWENLRASYTAAAGYSFLIFNLLCAPCISAVAAIRTEMNSTKWLLGTLGWQTGLAYVSSLIVYQIATWISGGAFGIGTIVALVILSALLYMFFRPNKYKHLTTEEINAL